MYDYNKNIYLNCDCMELMKQYPDKHFDLAIVDPPYGIGDFKMNSGGGKKKVKQIKRNYKEELLWNNEIPNQEYFNELKRISKRQIIFGANYYNSFSALGGAFVWYKNIGHHNLSQCEIASLSFQKKVDFYYYKPLSGFIPNTDIRYHPCQKPIELYLWLLKNYAKQGDLILDTHVGSASSLIAFEELQFNYVACELDKDYYEQSKARLEKHRSQLSLF